MSDRITALTCPQHENCVALLVLGAKSEQKSPTLAAPKWAQDWVNSQPEWYLRELTHQDAQDTPDGLLPLRAEQYRLENAEKDLWDRTDYLETLVFELSSELSARLEYQERKSRYRLRERKGVSP